MKKIIKIVVTLLLFSIALYFGYKKYQEYFANPWTRDAQVRSYVVEVAPRVTGNIVKVAIKDNQFVHKGDLLFVIDDRKYKMRVAQIRANIKKEQINLRSAKIEYDRVQTISKKDRGAVSQKDLIRHEVRYTKSLANLDSLKENLDAALLDLEWTRVYAPIDGYVTNLNFQVGSLAVANRPLLALVDGKSFWVVGYFRETMIQDVSVGDRAKVILMAYKDKPIDGIVDSIGWGIAPSDGNPGVYLLPKVKPIFQWIRLAQRIPVRIHLTDIPDGVELRMGMSASVIIHKK